jgi:WD40 repeat protein/beta-lactamase regulating signal transducer with metallopeptidase domain
MDAPVRLPWAGVTLVQVTAVAALGLLAWAAARRRGPALRGAVVFAALAGLLAVPALATVAPVWLPLAGLAPPRPAPEPPPPPVVPPPAPDVVAPRLVAVRPPADPPDMMPPGTEEMADPADEFVVFEDEEEPAAAAVPPAAEKPSIEIEKAGRAGPSAASILVGVWLVGAVACLVRSLLGVVLLYRWARRAKPVPEADWAACLGAVGGDRPAVAVRESRAVGSPLTLGLFRPVILLPSGWRGWSAEQLRLVLAHELAHVRRGDFLAGLVAELAVCVCWFHPLVRWLAGRLRLEQEYAADAWAASAGGDAMAYARCLARLALEQGAGRRAPAPAFWRRRPEILRRIDMLRRNQDRPPLRLGRRTASAVAALAAAACVAVAGVGPRHPAADDPKPNDPAPAADVKSAADPKGDPLPAGAVARLGTTRWRHGATITFVAFRPDGKTLVTAGQDGTVRLWDVATGKEIRRFARPGPSPDRPAPVRPPALGGGALPAVPAPPARPNPAKPGDDAKAKAEAEVKAKLEAARAQLEAAALQRRQGAGGVNGFAVALSPDGKTLAVAGGAMVVQLYDVESGAEGRKLSGASTGTTALAFSPDGKALAGRAADGGTAVWDVESGAVRFRLRGPARPNDPQAQVVVLRGGGSSPGLTFTPDGKAVVVVSAEVKDGALTSTVKFWDVTTGQEVRELKGPLGNVSALAISPDGKVLVYTSGPTARAFDATMGDELYEFRLTGPPLGLVFSPDGKRLVVTGRNQQARVHDAATGKELYAVGDPVGPTLTGTASVAFIGSLPANAEVRTLAFSPDGKQVVTASGGTVRLWDAATGKEIPLADGHIGPLAAVVPSPDGKAVVTLGTDRTVRRWDAATGKPLGSLRLPPGAAALSADGRTVVVAADAVVRLLNTADGKEVTHFQVSARGAGLAFSPDGKRLAERGADGVIRLYDTANGEFIPFDAPAGGNNGLPPGVVLVAANGRVGVGTGTGMAFSPDGRLLAVSTAGPVARVRAAGVVPPSPRGRPSGGITLYDTAAGKAIRTIEAPVNVVSFAFSPDGRVLATENADETVTLWEVASGKERGRLGRAATPEPAPNTTVTGALVRVTGTFPGAAEPAGPVTLSFAPDGRTLATRGPDKSVRVWDVDGGSELGQFKGHDGRVEAVAFTADGKSVVSGGGDTTVLVWDAAGMMKAVPTTTADLTDPGAAWADLADPDAGKAARAVRQLAAAPRVSVPFLAGQVKPTQPIDPAKLAGWVADLEGEKYAVRQEAAANLLKAGEQAVPPLRKVLAGQPTIETRLRVEQLLDKLTGGVLTAEQLRVVRAVEALERAATPGAKELLRSLAGGAAGALPTREAQAALDRLPK